MSTFPQLTAQLQATKARAYDIMEQREELKSNLNSANEALTGISIRLGIKPVGKRGEQAVDVEAVMVKINLLLEAVMVKSNHLLEDKPL